MRIAVLGATGGVGGHLVRHALADGHEVIAAVRDPARLSIRHEHLDVVRADALDATSVKSVVHGVDAVLSGIGQAGRTDPLRPASTSARAVVDAMNANEVRRLVVVSAAPLNRDGRVASRLNRLGGPVLWRLFRDVYVDLERMEAILRDSTLDWTSVRPPKLVDKPGHGTYRFEVEGGPAGSVITRADVARAMLDFVGDPATFRHAVGVSR